jgi:NAD-dependent dihydropyrimidine dehydrogenase PreA subunit
VGRVKLLVTFARRKGGEPIIARVVKDTGVLICVDRARIDSMAGEVLIDVPDSDTKLVCERMQTYGAQVRVLERAITRNEEECVDCGACISVCPRDVFSFDADWHVHVEGERCVLCGKCISACPHAALSQLL